MEEDAQGGRCRFVGAWVGGGCTEESEVQWRDGLAISVGMSPGALCQAVSAGEVTVASPLPSALCELLN